MRIKLSEIDIEKAYSNLIERSKFDTDFIVLTASASIICTLGFIMDNAPVIIGAMVVSPLLYPVLSLSTSLLWSDSKIIKKSFSSLINGCIIAMVISSIISFLFPLSLSGSEIIERLSANPLIYFLIAFFSGFAGTFAFFWPGVIEAMTGIAISVALLPPLCILGIAFAGYREALASSGLIVILNIAGIILGSITTLSLLQAPGQKK